MKFLKFETFHVAHFRIVLLLTFVASIAIGKASANLSLQVIRVKVDEYNLTDLLFFSA